MKPTCSSIARASYSFTLCRRLVCPLPHSPPRLGPIIPPERHHLHTPRARSLTKTRHRRMCTSVFVAQRSCLTCTQVSKRTLLASTSFITAQATTTSTYKPQEKKYISVSDHGDTFAAEYGKNQTASSRNPSSYRNEIGRIGLMPAEIPVMRAAYGTTTRAPVRVGHN